MQPWEEWGRIVCAGLESVHHIFLSKNQNYCRTTWKKPATLREWKLRMKKRSIFLYRYVHFFREYVWNALKNYQERFKYDLLAVISSGELDPGKSGLMESENMLLILCFLFKIGAGRKCEFYNKSQRKNEMKKKYTQNITLRLAGFRVFSLISGSTNRKNGRSYSNRANWMALILRYSGNGKRGHKAINYHFLVLKKDKGSSWKMRTNHPSQKKRKMMTLGLQAGHFKLCFYHWKYIREEP